MARRRSNTSKAASSSKPAAVPGQVKTDAGGRPQVDEGGRPIVAGTK